MLGRQVDEALRWVRRGREQRAARRSASSPAPTMNPIGRMALTSRPALVPTLISEISQQCSRLGAEITISRSKGMVKLRPGLAKVSLG
jgi:hypothetical protein